MFVMEKENFIVFHHMCSKQFCFEKLKQSENLTGIRRMF